MDWFLYDNGLRHERVKQDFWDLFWRLFEFFYVYIFYIFIDGFEQVNVCRASEWDR